MNESMYHILWSDIYQSIKQLKELIVGENQIPDVVITVGRGGLIPGALLAYSLEVKTVINFTLQSYDDTDNKRTDVFKEIQSLDNDYIRTLKDKRVLVVDDLSDTGQTLLFIKEKLSSITDLQFATLYTKASTKLIPNYYITEFTDDTWLVFPWETS